MIFFKIEFQDSLGYFWNNFFSTIILISIPYTVLYLGLDFWDNTNESVSIINFSPFAIFYGFFYLKDALEDFFKIHILIIVFTTIFLSFILIFILLKITKTARFYEKSKKIEVNDLQFQVFIFKNKWVKHYIFTYKKINSIANQDEIPSENKTYFFVLSEDEYMDLKNEIGFFKNEIISIKSFQ